MNSASLPKVVSAQDQQVEASDGEVFVESTSESATLAALHAQLQQKDLEAQLQQREANLEKKGLEMQLKEAEILLKQSQLEQRVQQSQEHSVLAEDVCAQFTTAQYCCEVSVSSTCLATIHAFQNVAHTRFVLHSKQTANGSITLETGSV